MTELSVHDNNVYAYVVLCEQRQIVLHTELREATPAEYSDVTFTGVAAHHVEDVMSGNILFEIEQVDMADLIGRWSDLFARRKNYGWPEGIKYADRTHLISILEQRGIKAFEIRSSYGLSGWVLALTVETRPSDGRAKPCRPAAPGH